MQYYKIYTKNKKVEAIDQIKVIKEENVFSQRIKNKWLWSKTKT